MEEDWKNRVCEVIESRYGIGYGLTDEGWLEIQRALRRNHRAEVEEVVGSLLLEWESMGMLDMYLEEDYELREVSVEPEV